MVDRTADPRAEAPADLLQVAERALRHAEHAGASAAEALVTGDESALTRFANSEIHQNVAERSARVSLRFVLGRRVGVASTGRLDEESLLRLAETARDIARLAEERDEDVALPEPGPLPEAPGACSEATATAGPELRAAGVRAVIAAADEVGVTAYGSFATSVGSVAVASSTGIRAFAEASQARLITVSMAADGGSGYAERAAVDVTDIDAESVGREAAEKARATASPVAIEPGDYPVVLEPYAVVDVLTNLAFLGFNALAVEESRSFAEPGKRIGSDLVSIYDDGLDPAGLPFAIDFEGVGKQRVSIVERGICRDVVYDAQTAAHAGRRSTGHGLPAPNPWGPFPLNLFMAAGDTSRDELIGGLDRGLLVTRFHYTNPVHPKLAIVTGMTRDGTFLVEGGRIVAAVRNLRFTQSYLDALAAVSAVGRERPILVSEFGTATVAPAIRVDAFTFTGATEH